MCVHGLHKSITIYMGVIILGINLSFLLSLGDAHGMERVKMTHYVQVEEFLNAQYPYTLAHAKLM